MSLADRFEEVTRLVDDVLGGIPPTRAGGTTNGSGTTGHRDEGTRPTVATDGRLAQRPVDEAGGDVPDPAA